MLIIKPHFFEKQYILSNVCNKYSAYILWELNLKNIQLNNQSVGTGPSLDKVLVSSLMNYIIFPELLLLLHKECHLCIILLVLFIVWMILLKGKLGKQWQRSCLHKNVPWYKCEKELTSIPTWLASFSAVPIHFPPGWSVLGAVNWVM